MLSPLAAELFSRNLKCRLLIAPVVASTLALALSGCLLQTTAVGTDAVPQLHGVVHGGQQAISSASIQLFAAGTSGYGTGAVSLLTNPVATDGNGAFTITGDYTCPGANSQLYLVARGGNPGLPGGANNTAMAEMAALGPCTLYSGHYTLDPSQLVVVNEVTTVAAVYSLRGFMSPATSQIGTSSGNATGLANAFVTANNLASVLAGQAVATTPAGNGTAPQATVNALANSIAACVNTNGSTAAGSACGSLFTDTTPAGGATPTDTLQALYNIATSPANQAANIFALAASSQPFQPALTSAPNDWSMSLVFTAYGSTQMGIAIDASGDAWVSNEFTSSTNLTSSVTEFASNGAVLSGPAGFTGAGLSRPAGITIDPSGNVWLANTFTESLSEFNSQGGAVSGTNGYPADVNSVVAADGLGHVWYISPNGVGEVDSGGNLLSPSAGYPGGGLAGGRGLAFDNGENAWLANNVMEYGRSGLIAAYGDVTEYNNQGVIQTSSTGYQQTEFNTPAAIAIDSGNNVWVEGGGVSQPAVFELSSTGTFLSPVGGYQGGGLTNAQSFIAIDGAGQVWVPINYTANNNTVSVSAIVALSNQGTVLSGANGYQLPTQAGYPRGLAVDGSGNVWVPISGTWVVQVVGAATPVITPLSVAVQKGAVGTRP